MTSIEFWTRMNPDQTLPVPPAVADRIPATEEIRVVVIVPDPADDPVWTEAATAQFLRGYDERDDTYDDRPTG
jgi:hypothetical protein